MSVSSSPGEPSCPDGSGERCSASRLQKDATADQGHGDEPAEARLPGLFTRDGVARAAASGVTSAFAGSTRGACRNVSSAEPTISTVIPISTKASKNALLRRAVTANTVFADREHLVRAVRSGMRRIQRNPALIDGCLAGTGLPPTT
ncbi:hypothetical protein [Streptomyces paromomycinus]|uniref:hypothetical protein n=1 Tax=Streptomyces paromomycinus TaxID=92743 RepID=UPI000F621FE1|nr:hypothetical protein [Streptomyces paromomycinus]